MFESVLRLTLTIRLFLYLSAVIFFSSLSIGLANADNIRQALADAYQFNPTLQAQRASLRAVDEQVSQAISNWRPSLSATGDLSRERLDTIRNNPRSVGIDLTQPLFRGFRTVAATRKAENNVEAARARLLSVEQQVLLSAATQYMNVVRDQAVLDLNVNNEQVLTRQLEATQDRFKVGEVTRTDVSQSEARLAGAKADRIKAEGDLETTRAAYKTVVGMLPGKLSAPLEQDLGAKIPQTKAKAMELAKDNHPDVIEAIYNDRAARDDIAEIRGELLPTINIVGSSTYQEDGFGSRGHGVDNTIGAELSMPLYQSGSVYSRLRAAKQVASENMILIDKARRDVVEAASKAWDTLVAARARTKSFQAQVNANEIALEGVKRENQVGSRTVLDVLDAEQELLTSRVNLVGAKRDLIVAIFELEAAIGRLTSQNLNLPAKRYDPTRHYDEVRDKWFGTSSSGDTDASWLGPNSSSKPKK